MKTTRPTYEELAIFVRETKGIIVDGSYTTIDRMRNLKEQARQLVDRLNLNREEVPR
jgi:hypothetical protein